MSRVTTAEVKERLTTWLRGSEGIFTQKRLSRDLGVSPSTIGKALRELRAEGVVEIARGECSSCCYEGDHWFAVRDPNPAPDDEWVEELITDDVRLDAAGSRANKKLREMAEEALPGEVFMAGSAIGSELRNRVRAAAGVWTRDASPDYLVKLPDGTYIWVACVARSEKNDKPGRGFSINRTRFHIMGKWQSESDRRVLWLFGDGHAAWHSQFAMQPGVNWRIHSNGHEEFMLVDTENRFPYLDGALYALEQGAV